MCRPVGSLTAKNSARGLLEKNAAASVVFECTPAAIYGLVFETESGVLKEVCRDEGTAAGAQ